MDARIATATGDLSIQGAFSNATQLASTAGLMTRIAYEHARKAGLPAKALARRVGLTQSTIQDWRARIATRDQVAFLDSVAIAVDDDSLGFHLAQDVDFRAAGLFFYVLASSGALIEVFKRGARYTSLVNESVTQTCIDRRVVGLELQGASARHPASRHEAEFWLTAVLRLARELTNKRLAPQRVCFAHERGRCGAELSKYFVCDVEYGASCNSLLFSRGDRDLKIRNADPYLNRVLIDFCEKALRQQRKRRPPFEAVVEDAIATLLPHGDANMSVVARRLNISERTLARKLAKAGVGFSALRTRLRQELAQRYLKEPELSISEIAWLLGFRDVGAFSHAFKRWTGRAPRQVRAGG
jgi:AraC-like DNA-binding protein